MNLKKKSRDSKMDFMKDSTLRHPELVIPKA